jgi:hypothetical protein
VPTTFDIEWGARRGPAAAEELFERRAHLLASGWTHPAYG